MKKLFDFENTTYEEQKDLLERLGNAGEQRHKTRLSAAFGRTFDGEPTKLDEGLRARVLPILFDRLAQYEHGEGGIEGFSGMVELANRLDAITPMELLALLEHYKSYTVPTYESLMADAEAERVAGMDEYEKNE